MYTNIVVQSCVYSILGTLGVAAKLSMLSVTASSSREVPDDCEKRNGGRVREREGGREGESGRGKEGGREREGGKEGEGEKE